MSAEFKSRRKEFITAMRKAAMDSVADAAAILQREVVLQLNKRGSNKAAGNIPSPPGEPPAKQSGALGRSIVLNTTGLTNPNPRAEVGTSLRYARIHEFGGRINIPLILPKRKTVLRWKTKSGSIIFSKFSRPRTVTMPPRPYFRPGIAVALPKIEKRLGSRFAALSLKFGST